MTPEDPGIQELRAEAQIRRVLARYARGIDRLDLDLVRSCYHPDATDSHGSFAGTVDEFVTWVERVLRRYDLTMHLLGSPLIELAPASGADGPTVAAVETPGIAFHRAAEGPPEQNLVTGFRFLDRFECRAGAWRIARRVATTEWSRIDRPDDWWPIPDGMLQGRRDRTDAVYDLLRDTGLGEGDR
ncbi:MAG: nuclear transport factor 2 family protein [Actinobacteria bacterium]|nr:nuclear transport factor 2 family protein [Actinomycetota bacterium]